MSLPPTAHYAVLHDVDGVLENSSKLGGRFKRAAARIQSMEALLLISFETQLTRVTPAEAPDR